MDCEPAYLKTPFSEEDVVSLQIGRLVYLSGVIFTARDAAHQRMWEAVCRNEELPFDPDGQVLYYVAPAPARPGSVIGPAGPTTASRMDPHTEFLLERGLRGMIGKGKRSPQVRQAMRKYKSVYFGAIEGTAALIARCVRSVDVFAYEDLGAEAMRRLSVQEFPVIVVNDIHGGDLYEAGMQKYRRGSPPQRKGA